VYDYESLALIGVLTFKHTRFPRFGKQLKVLNV
jgi:hypothetical protein